MPRTAEVIYVGDAASLLKASAEAAAAAEASADRMVAANRKLVASSEMTNKSFITSAAKRDAALKGFATSAKSVGGTMSKYVTAPVVAAAAAGVDFSMKFQAEMLKVRSQAGASKSELDNMSKSVLAMAPATQQGPIKLAEALYQLESVGVRGARALSALHAASEGAALGGANLEETTSALAAAMTAYDTPASKMKESMGILDATVGVGKMRMEELVESFHSGVLPVAAAAGVSLRSLGADLAVMTDRGVPATRGMTYLRQAIFYLSNETTKPAIGALEKLGLTSKQVGSELSRPDGLLHVVELLKSRMKGFSKGERIEVLKDLGGGARSATGLITAYESIGNSVSNLQEKYKKIGEITKSFHQRVIEQSQSLSAKMHQAWAGIQTALIVFGNAIAPIVAKIAGGVAKVAQAFSNLSPKARAVIAVFALVAAAMGPVLVIAGTLASALAALSLPMVAIGAVAAGAAILIATHWQQTKAVFNTVVNAIRGYLNAHRQDLHAVEQAAQNVGRAIVWVWQNLVEPVVRRVLPAIVSFVKGAFQEIEGIVQVLAGVLTLNFGEAWKGVKNIFSGGVRTVIAVLSASTAPLRAVASKVWDGIASAARAAWGAVKAAVVFLFNQAVDVVKGYFNSLYDMGKFLIDGLVKGVESGFGAVKGVFGKLASIPGKLLGDAWKLKSPSKLTESMGEMLAAGLVGGLLNSKEKVESGLTEAMIFPVDAAIEALQGKVKRIEAAAQAAAQVAEKAKLVEAVNASRTKLGEAGSGVMSSTGGTASAAFSAHGGSTGFFPTSGTNYSKGVEPIIAARIDTMARALGIHVSGVSGYRTPAHSVAVGGFADDPHTQAKASDSPGLEQVAETILRKYGLTRPFPGAKEADHVQLLPGYHAAVTSTRSRTGGSQKAIVEAAARAAGISPSFLWGVYGTETSFGKNITTSSTGAKGPFQFEPATAKGLGIKNVNNFTEAAYGAARLLAQHKGSEMSMVKGYYGEASSTYLNHVREYGKQFGSGGGGGVGGNPFVSHAGEISKLEGRLSELRREKLGLPSAARGKAGNDTRDSNAASSKRIQQEELTIREKIKRLKADEKAGKAGVKDGTGYKQAVEALKDFNTKATEAQKLSKLNIRIENLQKLKAYQEAIAGLNTKMTELAGQAAQAWKSLETGNIETRHSQAIEAIEHGGTSADLKAKKEADEAESRRQTEESNAEALTNAQKRVREAKGNENPEELKAAEKELKRAEEAITAFARSQDEKRAETKIEQERGAADTSQSVELSALDARTAAYEGMLNTQLNALTAQLAKAEINYAAYASKVNAILGASGIGYTPDAGTQQALKEIAGGVVPYESGGHGEGFVRVGMPAKASGGTVIAGVTYRVGETGTETFTPDRNGTITPASGSVGSASPQMASRAASVVMTGPVYLGSRRDADRLAQKVAHNLTFGKRG